MKRILCSLLLSLLAPGAFAEITTSVETVCDSRMIGNASGGGFGMLEVVLKLAGPEVTNALSMRVAVTSAQFEGGEVKEVSQARPEKEGFRPVRKGKKPDEIDVALGFENPPREVKKLKGITGSIDLLVPDSDPTSIITANIAKDAGTPLKHPALKAVGVEITLTPVPFFAEDNNLGYEIEDPQHKVALIEFYTPEGKKLDAESISAVGGEYKKMTAHFAKKPPVGTLVKIYLFTEKSVLTLPLSLTDITLP